MVAGKVKCVLRLRQAKMNSGQGGGGSLKLLENLEKRARNGAEVAAAAAAI